MPRVKRVAVVGAGLAGLVAARELSKAGFSVDVFERNDHVGGRTASITKGEFTFDTGALVLLPTYKNMVRLINELQLDSHLQKTKPQLGIVRDGSIHSFNYKKPIRSALSTGLLSWSSKVKIVKLLPTLTRYWRQFSYNNMDALCELEQETTQAYCLRSLNSEIDDYLADPFIRINSLTGSDQAPLAEFLWLLHAYFAPYVYHLDQGMDSFAKVLAQGVNISLSSEVLSVAHTSEGKVQLAVSGTAHLQEYDACVLAIPPIFSKQIYSAEYASKPSHAPSYIGSVKAVQVTSLHIGLNFRPNVEDALVVLPKCESKDVISIIFEHNKGTGRAPAGKAAITILTSIEWTTQNKQLSEEQVRDALLRIVAPFVGDFSNTVEQYAVSHWDYVCPVTYPGYFTHLREYRDSHSADRPVFYAGDYFSGGMEGAVVSGANAAKGVIQQLGNL